MPFVSVQMGTAVRYILESTNKAARVRLVTHLVILVSAEGGFYLKCMKASKCFPKIKY